jgi:hypothetical protein
VPSLSVPAVFRELSHSVLTSLDFAAIICLQSKVVRDQIFVSALIDKEAQLYRQTMSPTSIAFDDPQFYVGSIVTII